MVQERILKVLCAVRHSFVSRLVLLGLLVPIENLEPAAPSCRACKQHALR